MASMDYQELILPTDLYEAIYFFQAQWNSIQRRSESHVTPVITDSDHSLDSILSLPHPKSYKVLFIFKAKRGEKNFSKSS